VVPILLTLDFLAEQELPPSSRSAEASPHSPSKHLLAGQPHSQTTR
jgi:hypothetical protein